MRAREVYMYVYTVYHESWNFPAGVSFALKLFCLIYQALGGGGGVSCF